MFSFRTFPSIPRKQMWKLYPVFSVQSQKLVKTWKLFHSNNVFLKKFDWRCWKLNWQPCQFCLKLRKCFTQSAETTKKLSFSPKSTTFHHCSTGHVKAVWASCQMFFAPIQKQVTFVKVFEKFVFFKKFLWTNKRHFWQACRNHFRQNSIGLSLKVRKW